jgi:hypothetical protein
LYPLNYINAKPNQVPIAKRSKIYVGTICFIVSLCTKHTEAIVWRQVQLFMSFIILITKAALLNQERIQSMGFNAEE